MIDLPKRMVVKFSTAADGQVECEYRGLEDDPAAPSILLQGVTFGPTRLEAWRLAERAIAAGMAEWQQRRAEVRP